METEEITKLVDGIYKNILDKFNPGARQLINAGKAYLKALHGAAAASRLYVEAINKLARQAQQGTWGGSADVGSALLQIVEVYKEIQNQQMNILKAFYVDLLVPLETNLEKDTKVVQSEQKRFLQQHKQRSETYSKAAATMKKQRKKNKGSSKTGLAMDKELKSMKAKDHIREFRIQKQKNMQVLEEEKSKLDAFCEQSLKTAMTQERRRYGFVLERQCSLAKHYLAYHSHGSTILQRHLDDWQEVAQTREFLPEGVELMFNNRLRQVSFWPDEDVYSSPRSPNMEDDRMSITSQLRKTKSMDASCLDMRSINEATSPMKPLSRAKSDFNLTASTHSLAQDVETALRPKSMAVPDRGWDFQLARALYAYLSSGDNQLSFLEGDVIALMGERNKGWQFGENLRTQCSGWFPLAYTELITDDSSSPTHQRADSVATTPATPTGSGGFSQQPSSTHSGKSISTPVTMFGDTLLHHKAAKQIHHRGTTISANNVPPPTLPAPVPTPKVPTSTSSSTLPVTQRRLVHPPPMPPLPLLGAAKRPPGAIGNASLHSSNDSGFSNDPPPAPEVDYSDDDTARKPVARDKGEKRKKQLISSVRGWLLYKSALDLWDDVNAQQNGSRALALRQASSVGHLATLGRLSLPLPPQTASPPVPKTSLVKRSKSLWKFRRLHRSGDDGVLEGMALWQHRSLIDVHAAVMQEGRGSPSTPPTIKRKSVSAAPKPLTRTKLEQKEPPKPTERQSIKQAQMLKETQNHKQEQDSNDDQDKNNTQAENINLAQASKQVHKPSQTNGIKQVQSLKQTQNIREINNENSPPLTPRKPIPRAKLDAHNENDDGLLIPPKQSYTSSSEEEQEEEDDEDEQDEDEESCIVVDDHTTRLPRTRLLPERRQRDGRMSAPPPPPQQDTGLLYYGRTLQYRLKKPERGSRFDEVSATTGNMYGPWYDLWGIDPSVKQ